MWPCGYNYTVNVRPVIHIIRSDRHYSPIAINYHNNIYNVVQCFQPLLGLHGGAGAPVVPLVRVECVRGNEHAEMEIHAREQIPRMRNATQISLASVSEWTSYMQ